MDTLSLQRLLLQLELTPTEKLVGMALAVHMNRNTESIRVRQKSIAVETGYSVSTVKRAIKGLVTAGVFKSKRTGRAAILVTIEPQESGKNSGIVERSPVTYLIAHPRPIRKKNKAPWDYDLTYSTHMEEKGKREDQQLGLVKGGKSG